MSRATTMDSNDWPFEIADEDARQVILKVNAKDALTVARHPYLSSDMAYITISKGRDHTLSVINENGTVGKSFDWGESGYTLIGGRLEQLRAASVRFAQLQAICLDARTMSYPTEATIFYNPNFKCWQAQLGFADCRDEQLVYDSSATCAADMLEVIKRYNPGFGEMEQGVAQTGIDIWRASGPGGRREPANAGRGADLDVERNAALESSPVTEAHVRGDAPLDTGKGYEER